MKRSSLKRGKPMKRSGFSARWLSWTEFAKHLPKGGLGGHRAALPKRSKGRAAKLKELLGPAAVKVRAMPCLVCGRTPSDPHHEPPVGRGGTSETLVPLCRTHHTGGHLSRHGMGSATRFKQFYHVDLVAEAKRIHEEMAA